MISTRNKSRVSDERKQTKIFLVITHPQTKLLANTNKKPLAFRSAECLRIKDSNMYTLITPSGIYLKGTTSEVTRSVNFLINWSAISSNPKGYSEGKSTSVKLHIKQTKLETALFNCSRATLSREKVIRRMTKQGLQNLINAKVKLRANQIRNEIFGEVERGECTPQRSCAAIPSFNFSRIAESDYRAERSVEYTNNVLTE